MESLVHSTITRLFSEFVRNLTPDQVQVAVGGIFGAAAQATELRNLELDCDRLNSILRLDRLTFKSVTISWLRMDFEYFRLKHKPIELKLGTVSVEIEERETFLKHPPRQRETSSLLPYGKKKHALDSMSIDVQHLLIKIRILPHLSSTSQPSDVCLDVQALRIRRCDNEWRVHEVDLEKIWNANQKMQRKQGRVFVHRQLTCEAARCWLENPSPQGSTSPTIVHICEFHGPDILCRLRLFRYYQTSLIGSIRLEVIVSRLRLIFTSAQLIAAVSTFWNSILCLDRLAEPGKMKPPAGSERNDSSMFTVSMQAHHADLYLAFDASKSPGNAVGANLHCTELAFERSFTLLERGAKETNVNISAGSVRLSEHRPFPLSDCVLCSLDPSSATEKAQTLGAAIRILYAKSKVVVGDAYARHRKVTAVVGSAVARIVSPVFYWHVRKVLKSISFSASDVPALPYAKKTFEMSVSLDDGTLHFHVPNVDPLVRVKVSGISATGITARTFKASMEGIFAEMESLPLLDVENASIVSEPNNVSWDAIALRVGYQKEAFDAMFKWISSSFGALSGSKESRKVSASRTYNGTVGSMSIRVFDTPLQNSYEYMLPHFPLEANKRVGAHCIAPALQASGNDIAIVANVIGNALASLTFESQTASILVLYPEKYADALHCEKRSAENASACISISMRCADRKRVNIALLGTTLDIEVLAALKLPMFKERHARNGPTKHGWGEIMFHLQAKNVSLRRCPISLTVGTFRSEGEILLGESIKCTLTAFSLETLTLTYERAALRDATSTPASPNAAAEMLTMLAKAQVEILKVAHAARNSQTSFHSLQALWINAAERIARTAAAIEGKAEKGDITVAKNQTKIAGSSSPPPLKPKKTRSTFGLKKRLGLARKKALDPTLHVQVSDTDRYESKDLETLRKLVSGGGSADVFEPLVKEAKLVRNEIERIDEISTSRVIQDCIRSLATFSLRGLNTETSSPNLEKSERQALSKRVSYLQGRIEELESELLAATDVIKASVVQRPPPPPPRSPKKAELVKLSGGASEVQQLANRYLVALLEQETQLERETQKSGKLSKEIEAVKKTLVIVEEKAAAEQDFANALRCEVDDLKANLKDERARRHALELQLAALMGELRGSNNNNQ